MRVDDGEMFGIFVNETPGGEIVEAVGVGVDDPRDKPVPVSRASLPMPRGWDRYTQVHEPPVAPDAASIPIPGAAGRATYREQT